MIITTVSKTFNHRDIVVQKLGLSQKMNLCVCRTSIVQCYSDCLLKGSLPMRSQLFCEGPSKLTYSNKRPRKYHCKPETFVYHACPLLEQYFWYFKYFYCLNKFCIWQRVENPWTVFWKRHCIWYFLCFPKMRRC